MYVCGVAMVGLTVVVFITPRAQVQEKLPKFLTEKLGLAAGPLASHEPLQIMAEQGQALKSFEEGGNRGHCKQAVAATKVVGWVSADLG